jgi:hypothetical protein
MNMKLSYYWLGLGVVASAIALNLNPAQAQLTNGSDFTGIAAQATTVGGGGQKGSGGATFEPQAQAAVDQVGQSLNANNVGDATVFDVMNGADPAPLVTALVPQGAAADGATAKAAIAAASAVQGLRNANGTINAGKLAPAVDAYNQYINAMVGEVGPQKALDSAPPAQKALQVSLGQLVQVANQAAPAPAPGSGAPPAPAPAPGSGAPPAPPAPGQ